MSSINILMKEYGDLGLKLSDAQKYVLTRYEYYNDEQKICDANSDIEIMHSDLIKRFIDDLRNELLINHFINAEEIKSLFTKNFMNKIIKSALISGCAFVRIIKKIDGTIELIPYDAYYATGSLNNDNTLERALSIDDTDSEGNPTIITYYTVEKTVIKDLKKNKIEKIKNELGIIPMIPIIFNQDTLKPFGCSFITKKMMRDIDIIKKDRQNIKNIKEELSKTNERVLKNIATIFKERDCKKIKGDEYLTTLIEEQNKDLLNVLNIENNLIILDQEIVKYEENLKHSMHNLEYQNMIISIQQDLIDSINLIGKTIFKLNKNELKEKIDISFLNKKFNDFNFKNTVRKNYRVSDNYNKRQPNSFFNMYTKESPLINSKKKAGE